MKQSGKSSVEDRNRKHDNLRIYKGRFNKFRLQKLNFGARYVYLLDCIHNVCFFRSPLKSC